MIWTGIALTSLSRKNPSASCSHIHPSFKPLVRGSWVLFVFLDSLHIFSSLLFLLLCLWCPKDIAASDPETHARLPLSQPFKNTTVQMTFPLSFQEGRLDHRLKVLWLYSWSTYCNLWVCDIFINFSEQLLGLEADLRKVFQLYPVTSCFIHTQTLYFQTWNQHNLRLEVTSGHLCPLSSHTHVPLHLIFFSSPLYCLQILLPRILQNNFAFYSQMIW